MSAFTLHSMAGLLYSIKREYLQTFWSTKTAKMATQEQWLVRARDDVKLAILKKHQSYWEPLRDELTRWVHENISCWQTEEWFTHVVLTTIPEEMLPIGGKVRAFRRASTSSFRSKKLSGIVNRRGRRKADSSKIRKGSTYEIVDDDGYGDDDNGGTSNQWSVRGRSTSKVKPIS